MKKIHALAAAALASVTLLHADPELLTSADQTQIEVWLGVGPLQFTSIFSAVNGDDQTAEDFHAAVDNQGPTIVLADVTRGNTTAVIGGYDPVSWNGSLGDYTWAYTTAEQNAFIFNLSTDVIQRENLHGQGATGSGDYQTLNAEGLGPTWGQSFDLAIGDYSGNGADLLNYGSTFNYSYGGYSFGNDILGDPDLFVQGNRGIYDPFTVNSLEVYTFGPLTNPPSGVPDGGCGALLLAGGLLMLALSGIQRQVVVARDGVGRAAG